jgi:hypothetical protein
MLVKCLYCDADNDATATGGYCEACGKKLPASAMVRPRRTIEGIETTPDSGPAPVPRQRAVVSEALLVAAVVHLVGGGMFLILGPMLYHEVPARFAPHVLSWTILPTLVVAGLAWLARHQGEAAAVLGLCLALAWVAASFLVDSRLAAGWLLVQVVLLALLGRAVWLALRPQRRGASAG